MIRLNGTNKGFTGFLSILLSGLCISCSGESRVSEDAYRALLSQMGNARIFFGHQSVGYNVLDGISEFAADAGLPPPDMIDSREPSSEADNAVYHSKIGKNGDPLAKISDFDALLRAGFASQVDIAFMKLCYVDFSYDTDAQAIFEAYRNTLGTLERDYPELRIVYTTVPLKASGFKDRIKRVLGRPTDSREVNIVRERFNALVRAEYAGKKPLFDIAMSEATGQNGRVLKRQHDNTQYYELRREYTTDLGHLNATGRRQTAMTLLETLGPLLH